MSEQDKPRKEPSYLPRSWASSPGREKKPPEQSDVPAESQAESVPSSEDEVQGSSGLVQPVPAQMTTDETETPHQSSRAQNHSWPEWVSECPPMRWAEAPGVQDRPVEAESPPPRMKVNVVGVRFGYACKIYHFEAGDMALAASDWVIVKTEKGMGLGQIAIPPFERELDASQLDSLRKIIRKAGKVDFDQRMRCAQREAQAYAYCLERIEALDLAMKLVAVECFFDGSKYVFYFTAEGRVDFRELVKQLVARFPVRIEMRQIGVRHEAKMTGGLACCGQELCCSKFLTDFRPVSVKMAKNQNLSLNPTKISGVCGRLMCCLAYEHESYEEIKKGLPRVGKTVKTQKGDGIVVKHNPLAETISVRLEDETIVEVGRDEIVVDMEPQAPKETRRKAGAKKSARSPVAKDLDEKSEFKSEEGDL
jgi:cell fate regulator YaaT (PSP1 superfamily)